MLALGIDPSPPLATSGASPNCQKYLEYCVGNFELLQSVRLRWRASAIPDRIPPRAACPMYAHGPLRESLLVGFFVSNFGLTLRVLRGAHA